MTTRCASLRIFSIQTPQQVGKYLVSPLIHPQDLGRFKASVSIRSGRGSQTHDRVLRLVPDFPSSDEAARYALAEGMAWVNAAALPIVPFIDVQEHVAWPRKN